MCSCVVAGPSCFRCRRLLLHLLAVLAALGGRLQVPARSLVAVAAGLSSCTESVPCFPRRKMDASCDKSIVPPLCLLRGVQVCHGGDLPFLFGNQDASVCSRGEFFVLTWPPSVSLCGAITPPSHLMPPTPPVRLLHSSTPALHDRSCTRSCSYRGLVASARDPVVPDMAVAATCLYLLA